MYHNNHKRLSNYLSQPSPSHIRRSASQNSFLNASEKYYFQSRPSPRMSTNVIKPTYANSLKCQDCSRKTGSFTSEMENEMHRQNKNSGMIEEYFGPEIKTIRNTLLDIRDHMRKEETLNQDQSKFHRISLEKNSLMRLDENVYESKKSDDNYFKEKLKNETEPRQQINQALLEQMVIIEHENNRLNEENSMIKQSVDKLTEKLSQCTQELNSQIKKLQSAETAKNELMQRERELNLQLMDMRERVLKSEEYVNQLAFKSRQQKSSMAIIEEFNVMINWRKDKDEYWTQTQLTDIDIERQYEEVNEMQDKLCEKINGNLKIEKRMFSRIEEIDLQMEDLYERLAKIEELGIKMDMY